MRGKLSTSRRDNSAVALPLKCRSMRSCRSGYNTKYKVVEANRELRLGRHESCVCQVKLSACRFPVLITSQLGRNGEAVSRTDGPCAFEIDSALLAYDQVSRLVCDSCQKQDLQNKIIRGPACFAYQNRTSEQRKEECDKIALQHKASPVN